MSATNDTAVDEDPYQKICRAMVPGLLITVNCSTKTNKTGIDEMEVLRVDDSGDVHLLSHTGENFVLTHNDDQYEEPVIKEVSDTEFSPIHEQVETIEVIGIAE